MRIRLSSFAVALAFITICCGTALAGTVYTIRAGGTGGTTFSNLAAFKTNIVDAGLLNSGDVIEIHNDDASLSMPLELPANLEITIRSAGKRHTIAGGFSVAPASFGDVPKITIENVRIVGGAGVVMSGTYFVPNTNPDPGTLTISNSIVEDAGVGVSIGGNTTTTLTNVTFLNNTGVNAILLRNPDQYYDSEVNVIIDSSAPMYTHWTSDKTSSAIEVATNSDVDMNFDIASGKKLVVDGRFLGTKGDPANGGNPLITVNKTGNGVVKFLGDIVYDPQDYEDDSDPSNIISITDNGSIFMDISEGTVHFGEKMMWYNTRDAYGGGIHVGENGTFKPTISAGDLEERLALGATSFTADASRFLLDTFTSEKGASLEVGGISSMPFIGSGRVGNTITSTKIWYTLGYVAYPEYSNTANSMYVNNKLMEAYLELVDPSSGTVDINDQSKNSALQLRIERIENLSTLVGVGSYADVYRRMENLSEYERDMLDDIYNRGGAGSDIGFLQTLGGSIVQNSMLALRHNQANLINKINGRLTSYRKEELELQPEISGSEVCYYSDNDPFIRYDELWASIDQSWMNQKDVGTLAGYRYNVHSVTIGYDHHWDNWIAGGALNYSGGTMKLRNNTSTRTELDNLIAAVYASWALDGWYISGTGFAAYGWNDSESTFTLPPLAALKNKTGNYNTSSVGANLELGYMMETDLVGYPIRVTPYGGLTYARVHRSAVTESGATTDDVSFDRHFRAGNWNVWDAALGVRVAMPMDGDGYILVPSLDVSWTRTMGNSKAEGGDVHFIHDPSASWGLSLMGKNRSSLRMVGGLDAHFRNDLTVGANYEIERRDGFWKHQLNLSASLGF